MPRIKITTEEFILRAKAIHEDKFSYENTVYVGSRANVTVYCNKCSKYISVKPYHFTDKKRPTGCKSCQYSESLQNLPQDKNAFVTKATKIHGNLYDYTNSIYINSRSIIDIVCNTCKGVFSPVANNHVSMPRPSGCPACCKFGFDKEKQAILYYLKIVHEDSIYYKIGITNRTVTQRFTVLDLSKIDVVAITEYTLGVHAYNEEQKILQEYKDYLYTGPPILSSGNTELFITNVLDL